MPNFAYDRDMKERLMSYVANGSTVQAEYAATALGNMKDAETLLQDLVTDLCDELFMDASNLLTNLTSLAQFALYTPDLVSPSIDSIIRFIESDLLPAHTTDVCSVYIWLLINVLSILY
jgi:hypothetical protein